jgi:hypothetical protein
VKPATDFDRPVEELQQRVYEDTQTDYSDGAGHIATKPYHWPGVDF